MQRKHQLYEHTRRMKKPSNSSWVRCTSSGMCIVFAYINVVYGAIEPAGNFWKERKEAAARLATENQTTGPDLQNQTLLAQLPSVNLNSLATLTAPSDSLTSAPPPTQFSPNLSSLPEWVKSLSLPLAYSNFKKAYFPPGWKPSDPVVINIQDVHQNKEAQANIGKSIQHFINQGKIDLVALEGAFEPIDISQFREFEDQDAVHKVADYMLRENKISGAIHTAFTSPKAIPPFVGVDDDKLYHEHVQAYKDSTPKAEVLKKDLVKEEEKLAQEKATTFNKELLDFDSQVQAYRKGTLPLGQYVKNLTSSVSSYPRSIEFFLKALAMENTLDFKQVEAERGKMIQALVNQLSKAQVSQLLNCSLSYRLGRIRHTDFYAYLRDLCEKSGIRCKNYPAMEAYIRYVLLSDQINAERLLADIRKMEEFSYESLAKTKKEKDLVVLSRQNYLTDMLLDFALTPEEWKEYQKTTSRHSLAITNPNSFKSFESFFEHADLRDQSMSANLLKVLEERKAKVAVLVTGGYHSMGMEAILERSNIAVITLAPKITKIESSKGTEYLSVFTQEKTPLEKLFDGDKLFVTQLVCSAGNQRFVAALTLILGQISHKMTDGFAQLSQLLKRIGDGFSVKWRLRTGTEITEAEFTMSDPDGIEVGPNRLIVDEDSSIRVTSGQATGTFKLAYWSLKIAQFVPRLGYSVYRVYHWSFAARSARPMLYNQFSSVLPTLFTIDNFRSWTKNHFAPVIEALVFYPLALVPQSVRTPMVRILALAHVENPEELRARIAGIEQMILATRERMSIRVHILFHQTQNIENPQSALTFGSTSGQKRTLAWVFMILSLFLQSGSSVKRYSEIPSVSDSASPMLSGLSFTAEQLSGYLKILTRTGFSQKEAQIIVSEADYLLPRLGFRLNQEETRNFFNMIYPNDQAHQRYNTRNYYGAAMILDKVSLESQNGEVLLRINLAYEMATMRYPHSEQWLRETVQLLRKVELVPSLNFDTQNSYHPKAVNNVREIYPLAQRIGQPNKAWEIFNDFLKSSNGYFERPDYRPDSPREYQYNQPGTPKRESSKVRGYLAPILITFLSLYGAVHASAQNLVPQTPNTVVATQQSSAGQASMNFREFGNNTSESIRASKEIAGWTIQELEVKTRTSPVNRSFIDTLVEDNDYIRSRKFTHLQLADPLFAVIEAVETLPKPQRDEDVAFTYEGKEYVVRGEQLKLNGKAIAFVAPFDRNISSREYIVKDKNGNILLRFLGIHPDEIRHVGYYEKRESKERRIEPKDIIKTFFPERLEPNAPGKSNNFGLKRAMSRGLTEIEALAQARKGFPVEAGILSAMAILSGFTLGIGAVQAMFVFLAAFKWQERRYEVIAAKNNPRYAVPTFTKTVWEFVNLWPYLFLALVAVQADAARTVLAAVAAVGWHLHFDWDVLFGPTIKSKMVSYSQEDVQRGREFFEEHVSKPVLAQFLTEMLGPAQSGLSKAFIPSMTQFKSNPSVEIWAKGTAVAEPFFAQVGIALRTGENGQVPKLELRNVAHLAGLLGISEATTIQVTTELAAQFEGANDSGRIYKRSWNRGRSGGELALRENSIKPAYSARDAGTEPSSHILLLYLNGLKSEDQKAVHATAEHATQFVQGIEKNDKSMRALAVRVSPLPQESTEAREARLKAIETEWKGHLASLGGRYGLTSTQLANVRVVIVETNTLLTQDDFVSQALQTLNIAVGNPSPIMLRSYTLGLYTATGEGLDLDSLRQSLYWLMEGGWAVPVLRIIDDYRKSAAVIATQA